MAWKNIKFMRANIICLTIFLMALVAVATCAAAADSASTSTDDLKAFVDKAADYAQQNGKDKALAEFNNKEGEFVDGALYIFANDLDGICLAHPMKPEFVGKSQQDLKDVNGVPFIKNMASAAESGSGFTYYIWANPAHDNKPELKLVYVKNIDDSWYVGSGIYLSDYSLN